MNVPSVAEGAPKAWRHRPKLLCDQSDGSIVSLSTARPEDWLGHMHDEERVLRATFPDYRGYMERTARLIPGIY